MAVLHGSLGRGKLESEVRERVAAAGPAHQRVLPALLVVGLDAPFVGSVVAGLCGGPGWKVDANSASFELILWDVAEGRDIRLRRHDHAIGHVEVWGLLKNFFGLKVS